MQSFKRFLGDMAFCEFRASASKIPRYCERKWILGRVSGRGEESVFAMVISVV
jgi:hypothetical protein